MVYALLNGRLGNNLFQIATAASIAARNNTDFMVYPPESYTPLLKDFTMTKYLKQFEENILKNVKILTDMPAYSVRYQEKSFPYEKIDYVDNMIIDGFFQSEKYFEPGIVRSLFEIDPETKSYIENKYGHLLNDEITSIHVRRGDYFGSVDNHPVCSIKYFRKAIERIGKNKRFLVISDDIVWCKKKFKGDNFTFSDNESAIVDLYLQSFCTNNIMSNSSFSWWGAWMNPNPEKMVIGPYPWFGVAKQSLDTKDLMSESWIKIRNRMPWYLSLYGYYLWWDKRIKYFIKTKIRHQKS